ncbi:response regulator [Chitinophaga silvatica]|uniref:histidine kinase n=1 Tax=Chitinophaga silvatica TaxID=2282649 RepID=A0A3E1Y5J6_9BACT|nr:hybrid sensor histidine kinase/response regulator [Chitinophaga silvatica]RFS20009.1 response regulator [Chitinophaga silvatica]
MVFNSFNLLHSFKAAVIRKINYIRNIGTNDIEDEKQVANIVMTNSLSLAIGTAIFCIAPIVYLLTKSSEVLISIIIEFLINASVIIINYYRKHILAGLVLYFLQCTAIAFYCFLFGGIIQLQFMITFLISISCLIFAQKRLRIICMIAAILTLAMVQVGYYFSFFKTIPVSYNSGFIIQSMAIAGVLVMIIVVSKPYIFSNDAVYELRKANRFKRIFVAEVTHELRAPLNNIYLSATLMKRDIKLNAHLKCIEPFIDQQLYACENARNIINNVLDFAKIEAGAISCIEESTANPEEFFSKLIASNEVIAKIKRIRILFEINNMGPAIISDWQQIQQIATNLLANAIKYSPKGSTVYFMVTGYDNHWQIQVKNTGIINQEKLDIIFDPFVRDNKPGEQGSGLGLFIVKNKVKAMGGIIEAKSEDNATLFSVSLPLRAGKPEDIEEPENQIYDLSNIEVLIAEDDPMGSKLLELSLQKNDCQVRICSNGKELLEKLEISYSAKRLPDIIILDDQMPVMTGKKTLQYLKTDPRFKNIPVVFVTGEAYQQTEIQSLGVADVITKPLSESLLLRVLNQHVKHSHEYLQE